MVAIFDLDSIIYKSCYKLADEGEDVDNDFIIQAAVNRIDQKVNDILIEIENSGLDITESFYYIGQNKECIRTKIYPEYKKTASRKKNTELSNWVRLTRKYLVNEMDFAKGDDLWEADDLVIDKAIEAGKDNFVIVGIDKDLQQIPGLFFNYNTKKKIDKFGGVVYDDFDNEVKEYIGLHKVTRQQALKNYYTQLIIGDSTDNIKGVEGAGLVIAKKIINEVFKKFLPIDETIKELEAKIKDLYLDAELYKIKKELSKDNKAVKRMTKATWIENYKRLDFLTQNKEIIKNAEYNYYLNKFLITLGKRKIDKILEL
jgi:5'-3' exonuclease